MKKLVIASLIMIVLGAVISGAVLALKGPEIFENDNKLVASSFEVDEDFSSLSIEAESNDIIFESSSDGKCHVECLDEENTTHEVTVEDDTLIITTDVDRRAEFLRIGIDIESPRITVYLPSDEYENLTVDFTTGDLTVRDFDFTGDINVECTTGDSTFENVTCANLTYNGVTGDIDLISTIVSREISVYLTTGDIEFDRSDAFEIDIEILTGDVSGTLQTAKTFDCTARTGDVVVPRDGNGGNCSITTSTGDISIDIAN